MKLFYILTLISLSTLSAFAQETSRLSKIETRLDDLELSSALRKIKLSGSFINQVESYHVNNKKTDLFSNAAFASLRKDSGDTYLNPYLMRLGINIDAAITNNLQFFSTIGMSKFWNLSGRSSRFANSNGNFKSFGGGYNLQDSEAHFDTAYVSYHQAESPWTLAVGRMTTNNGPPLNQVDGTGRSGTYPFLSYNIILDGVATIYNVKSMPENQSLKFRLFYTPFIQVDNKNKSNQVTDSEASSGSTGKSGEKVDSNGSFLTLLTEYSTEDLPWLKKLDLYHSIFSTDGYYDENTQKPEEGSLSGGCAAAAGICDSGVEYSGITSNTVFIGLNSLLGSNVTFTYSYNQVSIRNSGDDILNNVSNLYSLSYKFDNKVNAGHFFGTEYIVNGENKVPTDMTTLYSNNFYDLANGEGYHLYYTAPIGNSQLVRLGYMNYKEGDSKLQIRDLERKSTASYIRWKVFF